MKLLVFAHTPPPHHGQSYMVQLMLAGFGGDTRNRAAGTAAPHGIECYHVNARFSRGLEDIGEFQGAKIFLIFWFCLQAVWIRFRYGVDNFYYVPAPGKRVALYRDWLVMLLCRPFFTNVILHWHAAGLAKWLETETTIGSRTATYRLFRPVDLSIVLSRYNVADAQKLLSHRIAVVNNGIPDPCPDFENVILPLRQARFELRKKALAEESSTAPLVVKILFIAHCTQEKGLFAAAEAILQANRYLAACRLPVKLQFTAAGNFVTDDERMEFDRLRADPEFAAAVQHAGFVSGDRKNQLLREADLFLFPTRYLGENQPVNLIEAMAFGLPIITTRWRSLPEMLPPEYPGLVGGQNPYELASAIVKMLAAESGVEARNHFKEHFTVERHLADLAAAIREVSTDESGQKAGGAVAAQGSLGRAV
ncbi:MAG TPA: glycosyltransferase [Verrucomicrobiae bacterium]|nr:glycosyltransferase [Verrucomicrobiae bacterium]